MCLHWCSIALASDAVYYVSPPNDVIQDIVEVIDRYDIRYIREKRRAANLDLLPRKKTKVKYDGHHALKYNMCDWFDPMPRFNDRQFEQTLD